MTTMHLKTPVSFFPPASGRGKWHVKGACSDLSACGFERPPDLLPEMPEKRHCVIVPGIRLQCTVSGL